MTAGTGNTDDDLALLNHIAEEFGNHGTRAVEFLITAAALLQTSSPGPKIGETACYCMREALKEIPQAAKTPQRQPWRAASRAVVDARRRYVIATSLPGSDLEAALRELLQAVDDLELVHSQERIHQQRLLAVMAARTGTSPIPSGPIEAYQRLVDLLDEFLHSTVTMDQARSTYSEAIGLLRQLFMPPELRLPELAALAELASPTEEDVTRLNTLIASPRHLEYFFGRAVRPDWLALLDHSALLEPPEGQGSWPVFKLIDCLKESAPTALADWLKEAHTRWGSASPMRAWFIARAALDLGANGRLVVLAALKAHPATPHIGHLALSLLEEVDPRDAIVVEVADHALNQASGLDHSYGLEPIAKALHTGVTSDNWKERADLLVHKLKALDPEDHVISMVVSERAGSLADPVDLYDDERPTVLFRALVDVLRASRVAGASITDLLDAVDGLREDLRQRFRAWLLSQGEAPLAMLIDEIADAIATRHPCGDDVLLVDRVTATGSDEYVEKWRAAMGAPPSPEEVGRALADRSVEESWFRRRWWSALLPGATTATWSKANSVLVAAYGPATRESLTTRSQVEGAHGSSPVSTEDLAQMPTEEAACWISRWRPDASAWLVGARELARTLEAVVKESPEPWTASPLEVVSLLREPVYVSHYFRGLAHADSLPATRAEDIVEAVAFSRTHPWAPVPLGRDDFDYDPTWSNADDDGVVLLRRLADANLGFGGRAEQAWGMVLEAAERSDEPSDYEDPLTAAINRSQTRAVEAVFSLMGWEYRETETVRPQALAVLDNALRTTGRDGEQHRAVIAPRLPFLLFAAPEWLQERTELIFGREAPDGLAQRTVDVIVKWGRPNKWIYNQTRSRLLDAIRRKVQGALSFWLIAMLWRLDGYEVAETVGLLAEMGDERVSDAGETLGRLLREDDVDSEHVAVAVEFFESVVRLGRPQTIHGFGWFAEVRSIDEAVWLKLTARAARLSAGRLDWAHKVADRAATSSSRDGLEILNELVRGLPDEWDRGHVMEKALGALRRAEALRDTEAFRRLRTSLLERGVFDAQDV